MRVIRAAAELQPGSRKVCLAIGVFDGVHLGHQQVIRQTVADARQHEGLALAVTFDRHPNAVVAPERNPPLIYSLTQRLRAIHSLGVDAILLIRFDLEFSRIPAEEFIRGLARDCGHLHSVCVGSAFTFGHQRRGNVEVLKALGRELGFVVHGLASVSLDGKVVSSTRIREAVQNGNLDAASQMLGRPYSLAGKVVPGDRRGGQIGFPTANLDTTSLALPPTGVYAVHAKVQGAEYRAVMNLGFRPTVSAPLAAPLAEVHLLDFNDDLYGQELEVTFVEKIRDEHRFGSWAELKAQIERDIAAARRVF